MTCFLAKMKGKQGRKGSAAPMIAVITVAVIILNFLMTDAIRIKVFQNESEKRVGLAAYSVLGDYFSLLAKNYGLYAVYGENSDKIRVKANEMLSSGSNVNITDVITSSKEYPSLNLGTYSLIKDNLDFGEPLSDINVLEREISDIMTYKNLGNTISKVTETIALMEGAIKNANLYKRYAKVLEEYSKYKLKEKKLSVAVNGTDEIDINCANGLYRIMSISPEHYINARGIFGSNQGSDSKWIVLTENQADSAIKTLSLYCEPAKVYAKKNDEVLVLADEALEIREKLIETIEKYESDSEKEKESFKDDEKTKLYIESLDVTVEGVKRNATGEKAYEIKNYATKNSRILYSAADEWNSMKEMIKGNTPIDCDTCISILSDISSAYVKVQKLDYKLRNDDDGGALTDSIAELLPGSDMANLIKELTTGYKAKIPDDVYETLPSSETDLKQYFQGLYDSIYESSTVKAITDVIEGNDTLFGVLKANFDDMKDAYYIDDYIMTYFKSKQDKNEDGNATFFSAEIEYILMGDKDQKVNESMVYAETASIRTMLNAVHVFTDTEKREFCDAIGETVSAATYGIGAPIYSAVVAFAWASAEAVSDIAILNAGKNVPFLKTAEEWKTSFDGKSFGSDYIQGKLENEGGSFFDDITGNLDDLISQNYEGYLRLLLLSVPKSLKLKRIQDLLELNLLNDSNRRIKLSDMYTNVNLTATFRMKTILLVNRAGKRYYDRTVKIGAST